MTRDAPGATQLARLVQTSHAIEEWDAEISLPERLQAEYREIARELASLGEPTRPLLNDALTRHEPAVRYEAALALARLGGRGSTDALLTALGGDAVLDVRVACAEALGACGDPRAASALRLALRDEDERMRRVAAVALTACAPDVACDVLDEVQLGNLLPEPLRLDEAQLAQLASCLVTSTDPRATAHLVRLACDASGKVRGEALRALAPRLDGHPELAEELLRPCLSAPGVSESAAAHIGLELAQRGRSITDAMIPYTRSTSHVAAVLSSRALVRAAGADGAHGIEAALRGPNAGARHLTTREMLERPPELPRDELRRLLAIALADADPRNVASAVEVVARLGLRDELVLEIVATMARADADHAWLDRARAMIADLGPRAAPPLVALLGHPDADVRARAARLLTHAESPEALAALRGVLADPADAVRAAAERALASGRDPSVMARLVERARLAEDGLAGRTERSRTDALDLADECTICNAAMDIGHVGHPDAFEWLVGLADRALAAPPDARGQVSRAAYHRATGAIQGLGLLGDPRGARWIVRASEHPDFRLRRDAADALAALADPSCKGALQRLLRDADERVRDAARRALDGPSKRRG
ncbi:MAG: HEAT repeat domain-containing protein [Deltaproteobacteria bacterium]|nr:HEAT repeat domain-containing protein [Deltaproteobacteria bacterium]